MIEEKALMVNKPKKFFKKNFIKFKGNNSSRSENRGNGYKVNNSYSKRIKGDVANGYQKDSENKEKKLNEDYG